jgi:hypothetical protein
MMSSINFIVADIIILPYIISVYINFHAMCTMFAFYCKVSCLFSFAKVAHYHVCCFLLILSRALLSFFINIISCSVMFDVGLFFTKYFFIQSVVCFVQSLTKHLQYSYLSNTIQISLSAYRKLDIVHVYNFKIMNCAQFTPSGQLLIYNSKYATWQQVSPIAPSCNSYLDSEPKKYWLFVNCTRTSTCTWYLINTHFLTRQPGCCAALRGL